MRPWLVSCDVCCSAAFSFQGAPTPLAATKAGSRAGAVGGLSGALLQTPASGSERLALALQQSEGYRLGLPLSWRELAF